MGPRIWAAFGNLLKIFSIPLWLAGAVSAYRAIQLAQMGQPTGLVVLVGLLCAVSFVFAVLFWFAKGPLVDGSVVARFLVGLYMLLWVISTLGFALVFIAIAYFFTSEPEVSSGAFEGPKRVAPQFTPPPDWQATGRVGPSGAMLYSDAARESSVGIFTSGLPVQVMDRRDGLAHVVAADGEGGWIDVRTLTEGA